MNLKLLFIGLLTLSFAQCFSQDVSVEVYLQDKKNHPENNTIYYDFDRKLSWIDFKGKPNMADPAGAVCSSGFAFDSELITDDGKTKISIGVYCYFKKNDSWKKPGTHTGYHLQHEQLHFDITRLSAQKLVDELNQAAFSSENYNSMINKIFEKVYRDHLALQKQYDRETKNSINIIKQKEWNDKIGAEVEKLKNEMVVIKD